MNEKYKLYGYRWGRICAGQPGMAAILSRGSYDVCECVDEYHAHRSHGCDRAFMDAHLRIRSCRIRKVVPRLLDRDAPDGHRIWSLDGSASCRDGRRTAYTVARAYGAHQHL